MSEKKTGLAKKILSDPKMIVLGAAIGIAIGFYAKQAVPYIAPLGKIYLSLLSMCILPIIITAIISGVANLMQSAENQHALKKIAVTFCFGLFIPSVAGFLSGIIGRPGSGLADESREKLGLLLSTAEKAEAGTDKAVSIMDFVNSLIPENIFFSLSQGENLRIVVFSLLLGIALGTIKSEAGDIAVKITSAFYQSFVNIFGWLLYALPFGLLCIMADQMKALDLGLLLAMTKYISLRCIAAVVLLAIYHFIFWKTLKCSFIKPFKSLKQSLFLAFIADDSFLAMPSAIEGMQKDLKLDGKLSKMLIPLGIVINRHGVIMCFSLTAVFLMQFYNVPFTPEKVIIILVSSALAGMAALGPAITYSAMILFVIQPLGVPAELAMLVIIATAPLVDRLLAVINVYANCALTAYIIGKPEE